MPLEKNSIQDRVLIIRPAKSFMDYLFIRQVRNSCYLCMTRDRRKISFFEQLFFFFFKKKIFRFLFSQQKKELDMLLLKNQILGIISLLLLKKNLEDSALAVF